MNKNQKEAINYQFSGYQLPKIQLDSTGATYYYVRPHPYYSNQPLCWAKPFWKGEFANTSPKIIPTASEINENSSTISNLKIYKQLPI